jgi:hypothetical protein
MKVFWSWQDDSPGKVNRHFIKSALETAINAIVTKSEFTDAERPALDHDTQGTPGAGEIASIILDKIANCGIFVADVTPVVSTPSGKAFPNPNVMIELGWSLHTPGWERQIYIMNTATGYKPTDLPFDIRGRRIMQYSLPEDADRKAIDQTKKRLAGELEAAIRTNLNHYLDEKASDQPIDGRLTKEDEPSLWSGSENGFRYLNSNGNGKWVPVKILNGPKSYLRVIPASWKNRPIDVASYAKLDPNVKPMAQSRYSAGDFGAMDHGFISYWTSSNQQSPIESEDFSVYFDDVGEFWIVSGYPIVPRSNDRKVLDVAELFKGWVMCLRRISWILDAMGASLVRRVEVGLTGIENVCLPPGFPTNNGTSLSVARRSATSFTLKSGDWSQDAQYGFLIDALSDICRLFGVPSWQSEKALEWLKSIDIEKNRKSPLIL